MPVKHIVWLIIVVAAIYAGFLVVHQEAERNTAIHQCTLDGTRRDICEWQYDHTIP